MQNYIKEILRAILEGRVTIKREAGSNQFGDILIKYRILIEPK